MADAGGNKHSSGEYDGAVEHAVIAMSGKAQDLATTLSSGENARAVRLANRAKKEKEEQEKKEKEEREKGKTEPK